MLLLTLLLTATPPALDVPAPVSRLLKTGKWDATPKAFRIIALSYIADGCAFQGQAHPERVEAARACVDRAIALAEKSRPAKRDVEVVDTLWLEHFALMWGARDALGSCAQPERHAAMAKELARRSLADPHAHAASYASLADRWPADQSTLLAALARADSAHGLSSLPAPLEAWKTELAAHTTSNGLPESEVAEQRDTSKYARGCGQSMLARMTPEFAPELACTWWKAYRANYWVALGGPLVGFREWPAGVSAPADSDSGPIVFGIGTAASALGIGGARAMGDETTAGALERSANTAMQVPGLDALANQTLAAAIRFEARWQPAMTHCE